MMLPKTMKAMVMENPHQLLSLQTVPMPEPSTGQVLVKVIACGICRTDLHIIDGELAHPKLPLIPGHEIIGVVVSSGGGVTRLHAGDFVGIPWLGFTCGNCKYCLRQKENLCENALFTGYTLDGGYAEYTVAYEQYCLPLHNVAAVPSSAPLLCAGLIGYRSYKLAGDNIDSIGIYGFGAAAHIVIQLANYQNKRVFAFTKDGDIIAREFAKKLGAYWVGGSSEKPVELLDAAIIFAPAGELVPRALQAVDKGAIVVCGGIHMSDIPSFPYSILWGEKMVRSVANLQRKDGEEFLKLAAEIPVTTETHGFPLSQANEAIAALRAGNISGAAVLII